MSRQQIDSILDLHEDYAKLANKAKDAQFLSDTLEMGYGCVEEADFNLMRTVIAEHKTKLTEAKGKLDSERKERPSMIGFVAVPRGLLPIAVGFGLLWSVWVPSEDSLEEDLGSG